MGSTWSVDRKLKVTIGLIAALVSTSFGVGYKLAGFAFESDARIDVLEREVSNVKIDLSEEINERKKFDSAIGSKVDEMQPFIIDTNSRLASIEEGILWLKMRYREDDK